MSQPISVQDIPILPPTEIPENMKGHNNPNDLILNYFTFKSN